MKTSFDNTKYYISERSIQEKPLNPGIYLGISLRQVVTQICILMAFIYILYYKKTETARAVEEPGFGLKFLRVLIFSFLLYVFFATSKNVKNPILLHLMAQN